MAAFQQQPSPEKAPAKPKPKAKPKAKALSDELPETFAEPMPVGFGEAGPSTAPLHVSDPEPPSDPPASRMPLPPTPAAEAAAGTHPAATSSTTSTSAAEIPPGFEVETTPAFDATFGGGGLPTTAATSEPPSHPPARPTSGAPAVPPPLSLPTTGDDRDSPPGVGGAGAYATPSKAGGGGGAGSAAAHNASSAAAYDGDIEDVGAATIALWLEEIGLAEAPIIDCLASAAADLEALSLLSEAALTQAVSPLKMRGIKLRKLQAAFTTLRSPSAIDTAIAAAASEAGNPTASPPHGTAATQPQFTPRFTAKGAPQLSHRSSPTPVVSGGAAGGGGGGGGGGGLSTSAAVNSPSGTGGSSVTPPSGGGKSGGGKASGGKSGKGASKGGAKGAKAGSSKAGSGGGGGTGDVTAASPSAMGGIGEDSAVSESEGGASAFLAATAVSAAALDASVQAKAAAVTLAALSGGSEADAPQFTSRTLAAMDGTRHVTASGGGGGEGGGGEGDDGANPLFTPRTLALRALDDSSLADAKVGGRTPHSTNSEAAAAAAAAAATAAAIEAATPRTQAALLADEALALELQQQGDDEDDALEAALRLSAQEAGVAAGGGGGGGAGGRLAAASGGKKGARKGKAASPDKGAKKGKGSSLAAALTGGGKGGKGSAYFAVDIDDCGGRLERAVIEIGARQTITSLNKKWLAKPIRKGLVEPFVSQLAPHLKSQGIEIASDEIIISVDGRQIEGMEAASFFVSGGRGTADEPVPILLTLPFLPPASAILADPSLASWPGAYPGSAAANSPHAAAAMAKAKAAAAAASSSSAAAGGGVRYHEHPNRLESATFHVDISTAGKDDVVPTETTLQKKWLAKPLRQGLVLPALKAYMAQSWQADLNHLPITILVDGMEVDGTSPGAAYVRLDGETTTVAIILPPDALAPGAKAQMTFQVYIDDTGWTTPSETTLNKKWMMKPLLQALVEPALKHHCKSSALPPVPLHEVKIAVDGVETDGSPPAWTFLQLEGRPVRVDLALPSRSYTIRRISRR